MLAPRALALALIAGAALSGCVADPTAPEATLVVRGSAHAPVASPAASPLGVGGLAGDPASVSLGLYALHVSTSADCSDPVLVQHHGADPVLVDLMEEPLLFSGSPPEGSYSCVVLTMSDVIGMRPASSFGDCVAGEAYQGDIYRDGDSSWKDLAGAAVVGHGSSEDPVSDPVSLFLTRDPDAVRALGLSPHQTLLLGADLVVPGQSTFFWDGRDTAVSEGGGCHVQPGAPTFQ